MYKCLCLHRTIYLMLCSLFFLRSWHCSKHTSFIVDNTIIIKCLKECHSRNARQWIFLKYIQTCSKYKEYYFSYNYSVYSRSTMWYTLISEYNVYKKFLFILFCQGKLVLILTGDCPNPFSYYHHLIPIEILRQWTSLQKFIFNAAIPSLALLLFFYRFNCFSYWNFVRLVWI